MRLIFLGTGTSHGIPVIGCDCDVCLSKNQKNKRTRASVWIESDGFSFVIDTATEFRLQAIREGIKSIDFVLLTHSHADHIHGMDDLRPLSRERAIPVYGNPHTIHDIKKRFSYITEGTASSGGGKPRLIFTEITEESLIRATHAPEIICPPYLKPRDHDIPIITPIPVKHGILDIYGYRIGNLAYITDCSFIPENSMKLLSGIEILIIGALRYKPHPTHFSVSGALEIIDKTGCKKAFLTHMCHNIEHEKLSLELPRHVRPAFDGLAIDFS